MIKRLLSHDLPRSRWLALLLIAIVIGLAFAPFLFPGTKALNVAAKILIFIVLVASFDLLRCAAGRALGRRSDVVPGGEPARAGSSVADDRPGVTWISGSSSSRAPRASAVQRPLPGRQGAGKLRSGVGDSEDSESETWSLR